MDVSIEGLAQKVIDNNESAYDEKLSAVVDGYEFNIEKDPEEDDWYIQVNQEGEGFLYDGWWSNSEDKSLKDAVIEAIKGSCITV
ncbi:TPA: hypothetical protein ACN30N_004824 [Vibrio campbellii]